jgi:hypothetical protein
MFGVEFAGSSEAGSGWNRGGSTLKPSSKSQRLSWGPVTLVVGFSLFVFGVTATDWSELQAQEKGPNKKAKAKAKDAAKAEAPKAAEKKAYEAVKKTPPVLRVTPGHGKKLTHVELAKIIDDEVNRKLKDEGLIASGKSSDAEFFRRLSLDLVGVVPTVDQTKAFLDSKDLDKRGKAIEQFLADPRFGHFQGEIFSGLMLPRESNNRALDHKPMINWLAEEFNKNTPLNKIAFDLITSTGTQEENPAVTYFIANPTVDKITDNVSRTFLGVQLQCAQCHNHPFTDWKQKEYWGMAQFFIKTRPTVNPQMAAKKGVSPGIAETNQPFGKKNGLPESAMRVNAKFLGGEEPGLSPKEPYRPVFGQWLASPSNPYFAKAMTNRFWHHLFGRGIVNPVDDMHENNLPSHPELLNALGEQLKANNFDLKYLVRAICNSETYQRTSVPTAANKDDREFYSHRLVRTMMPEQLFDSLVAVTGREQTVRRVANIAPAIQKKGLGGGPREQFVNFFRVTEEHDPLEYETGIPQALRMMNSNATNALGPAIQQAIKTVGVGEPDKMVEELYLTALARRPTSDETARMVSFVRQHPVNPVAAYTDILWSMLNSSEFVLNH